MATETSPNAQTSDGTSLAAQLMKKHDEAHQPQIEDAVDEEDLAHPPPSAAPSETPRSEELLSEKAAGKRPARDIGKENVKPKTSSLDTQSEELFPALGGGPKPRAPAAAPPAWGARKPTSAANGMTNGHKASDVSSGISTPVSGIMTPPSTNASITPKVMSMPGKHTERIQFSPSQIMPRQQMKKPLPDVLRDINRRSKAKVEMRSGPGGTIIFEGTGPVEAVRLALKEIAQQIGSKVRFLVSWCCPAN